jgi:hypothetical protein
LHIQSAITVAEMREIHPGENPASARAARSLAFPSNSMTSPCPTITRSKSHPRIVASELSYAALSFTPAIMARRSAVPSQRQ